MQVSVEVAKGLERLLKIVIPNKIYADEFSTQVNELTKTAKLPGFRPGKVPKSVIQKEYGDSIRHDVLSKITQSSLKEALEKENLMPVDMPEVEFTKVDLNADFEYTAKFEVYPEVKLVDYKGIQLEKIKGEIADTDINDMLTNLQKQHVEWETVDRASKKEDKVKFDFTGFIDGEEFEGGKATDFELILGDGQMIPGFEDGIIGKKAGDEFEINVTFPKDYQKEDLAGKAAIFKIKLHTVLEPKYMELDDEFAKKFNIDSGIEGLKQEIRKNMENELEQKIQTINRDRVIDKVIELTPVELPHGLIKKEIKRLKQSAMAPYMQGNQQIDLEKIPDDLFNDDAKRNTHIGLIFMEYIKQNDIKADPDKVREKINNLAANYERPDEVVAYYYKNEKLLDTIESNVIEDQIIENLLANAEVTDKHLSYNQIMNDKKERSDASD